MLLSQPDPARPDELLGTCDNPACGEWAVFGRHEDRWMVLDRIAVERRDPANPTWKPILPAAREAAAR
jgi:hypothetical protein